MDFSVLLQPEAIVSLLTLTLMEIVLGIDNIIFITILCGRLPDNLEHTARRIGIGIALVSRIGLLFALSWVMKLTDPLFSLGWFVGDTFAFLGESFNEGLTRDFSGRDFILIFGGLFLIGKATHEIYINVEHPEEESLEHAEAEAGGARNVEPDQVAGQLASIFVQVLILDIVFSLDSVITAVGMAKHIEIMGAALIIAVIVMMIFSNPVGDFVQRNPSVRILALAFLVLIGVMLLVEGMGGHVSKGYIYSAIGFSLLVEVFNLRRNKKEREIKKFVLPEAKASTEEE